ncbi:hypothetical protein HDU67_009804, partial [Dinochytrium kinnereticum]
GTTLVDKFQAADTCFEGWEALIKEVNFDKDNRAEILIAQLHIFAQKARESDLDYADRMAELVAHLRALDYPDRSNQSVAENHDLMVSKKFRLGQRTIFDIITGKRYITSFNKNPVTWKTIMKNH